MLIWQGSGLKSPEIYDYIKPLVENSISRKPLRVKNFVKYQLNSYVNKIDEKIKQDYDTYYFIDAEDIVGYLIYNYVKALEKYQTNVENKDIMVFNKYLTTFLEKSVKKYLLKFVIGKKKCHLEYIDEYDEDEYRFRISGNNVNSNSDFDFTGLTEIQKKIIELKYYQNLSTSEIAKKTGLSSDNVRQLHVRAIQVLRKDNKHLKPYYNRLIQKVA